MTNAVLYSTHYSKLLSLTETFYSPSFDSKSIPQSEPNPIKKNNKNILQVLLKYYEVNFQMNEKRRS